MTEIRGSTLAQKLFHSTSFAWLWTIVRVWLGWTWLTSGWGKLSNPAWMETGAALRGYLNNALSGTAIRYDWYRSFLQWLVDGGHYTWFAKLVVFGEILVGLGLILGGLTAIAAFFGAFMNMAFMLAGTTSSNPVMFTVSILIMIAWKVAGWYGLDRWLLVELGTPWQPGRLFAKGDKPQPQAG